MRFGVMMFGFLVLSACKRPEPIIANERPVSVVNSDKLAFDFTVLFDTASLEKVSIGELYLPTGEIVASDPFFIDGVKPFNKQVEKGS